MDPRTVDDARWRRLVLVNVALIAIFALHDLDHLRQGRSIEPGVIALGVIGDLAAITSLILSIRRNALAPLASTLLGFATALGFVFVHIVPDWGPLSQGYPDLPVDAISWIAAIVPIGIGMWLGFTGLATLRRRSPATV